MVRVVRVAPVVHDIEQAGAEDAELIATAAVRAAHVVQAVFVDWTGEEFGEPN